MMACFTNYLIKLPRWCSLLSLPHLSIPLCCAILLPHCFYISAAFAEESASEENYFSSLPVVLHATRLRQAIDATPVSMTVIDRAMIESSSASSIPELLRYVPGFLLSKKSGHRLVSASHGLEDDFSRRMQVLINGRAIYDHAFGGVVWNSLPVTLDDIERVEVVRSANVAAFGAGALLGSINLITKTPAESVGTSIGVQSHADDGLGVRFRHAGQVDSFAYLIGLMHEQNNGLPDQRDDSQTSQLGLTGNWRLSTTDSLEFGLSYRHADEQWGFTSEPYDPLRDRHTSSTYAHISWRRINATDDEWQINFYRNAYASNDAIKATDSLIKTRCTPPGIEEDPVTTDSDRTEDAVDSMLSRTDSGNCDLVAQRYDIELQNIRRLHESVRLVWGVGARSDTIRSAGFVADQTTRQSQWRWFSNVEWAPTTSLIINAAMMYENPEAMDAQLSSRFGANYRLNRDHSLRLALSRAWRTSFFENYANLGVWWGDGATLNEDGAVPMLMQALSYDPERVDAYELGYLGYWMNRRLMVDVRLHYNDFTQFLDIDTADVKLYANRYNFAYTGIEAQIGYSGQRDSIQLGYSNTSLHRSGAREIIDAMPVYNFSLLYSHRFANHWLASISLFYVDKLSWLDQDGTSDAVFWGDIKMAKTIKLHNAQLDFSVTVQNLFDEPAMTLRQQSQAQRNFLSSLTYRF